MDGETRRAQAPLVHTKATIVGEHENESVLKRRVPRCQPAGRSFVPSFLRMRAVCTVYTYTVVVVRAGDLRLRRGVNLL